MADRSSQPTPDDIARSVLDIYNRLPQKCRPFVRDTGCREWVPLSGIVMSKHYSSGSDAIEVGQARRLECVALGTGMKCLPSSKLSIAHGCVLHDSHAEIVAIRALNRFLLDQCLRLANDPASSSSYIRRRELNEMTPNTPQPFAIVKDVSIHMYGSEAPCGDASMELIMAAQKDATPWDLSETSESAELTLKGRGSFAELGIVRRKPARPDAPPTLSKSCTDKLTMYQYTSVLNSTTSFLISPENAYLYSLTVPASQYIGTAIVRAFTTSGRLPKWDSDWEGGYSFRPFNVQTTDLEFSWSRRAVALGEKAIPSNISAVYTPESLETLINGVLQGRKIGDPKGASTISRKSLWKVAIEIASFLGDKEVNDALSRKCYADLKASDLLAARKKIKNHVRTTILKGWLRNEGDESFGFES